MKEIEPRSSVPVEDLIDKSDPWFVRDRANRLSEIRRSIREKIAYSFGFLTFGITLLTSSAIERFQGTNPNLIDAFSNPSYTSEVRRSMIILGALDYGRVILGAGLASAGMYTLNLVSEDRAEMSGITAALTSYLISSRNFPEIKG